MIKQLIGKFIIKQPDCIPESNMKKIREMYSALPEQPKARSAPSWMKREQTDGQSGENSS